MQLAELQKGLCQMLKETYAPTLADADYFQRIYPSRELALVKEIAVWWRALQILNYCPMTSRYLKMNFIFDDWIKAFYAQNNVSPFIEVAGVHFLNFLSKQTDDKILRSLSAFEAALLQVKKGSDKQFVTLWHCQPNELMYRLLKDPQAEIEIWDTPQYQTVVSAQCTYLFEVFKI